MIPIIIISGFLGSGKTTFLQKLLKKHRSKDRILVIENDFGEVSLDAEHIAASGVAVRDVTSGCICCSLQGDFRKALTDILKNDTIDIIYIEPSGISKLSEILAICADPQVQTSAYVHGAVTLVDAMQAPMCIKNFGLFFKDQITHSDALCLSHTEDPAQVTVTTDLLRELAPETPILCEDWDTVNLRSYVAALEHTHTADTTSNHHHHHHFTTETFRNLRILAPEQWQIILEGLPDSVLRAKGVVPTTDGPREIQYGTHYCRMEPTHMTEYHLVLIGTEFNVPMIANEVCIS